LFVKREAEAKREERLCNMGLQLGLMPSQTTTRIAQHFWLCVAELQQVQVFQVVYYHSTQPLFTPFSPPELAPLSLALPPHGEETILVSEFGIVMTLRWILPSIRLGRL